jgi:hypothetical protein
MQFP